MEKHAFLTLCGRRVSCEGLARRLGLSRPTAARTVAALRRKGARIVSVRSNGSWHYEVRNRRALAARQARRLRAVEGFIRRWKPMRGVTEDEIVYGVA